MEALVAAVSAAAAVGGPAVAEGIAAALQPFLGRPDLLSPEEEEPDPARYRQHLLHVAPDGAFSIVALVWLPGQETSIHDHLAWCVAGVHRGVEEEVQYRRVEGAGESWLTPAGLSRNATGSVGALTPPGDIHAVRNPGPGLAVSIHVYGVDLRQVGSSIRRRYDQPVRAV
jgi:3-mercaptopropionate dioxygenase